MLVETLEAFEYIFWIMYDYIINVTYIKTFGNSVNSVMGYDYHENITLLVYTLLFALKYFVFSLLQGRISLNYIAFHIVSLQIKTQ